ncbi:MAG TPA: peptide deformylase [Candidatus Peribacterales bacterium]|nr:peptide deformylase [Candidatus Peribacterales bacterium]
MAVLPIITGATNPILRAKAAKVTSFGKDLHKLISNLLETVHGADGAGLAAPQVGISQRVTVARIGEEFVPLINPEIIWKSESIAIAEEGCLSLPNVWLQVPRSTEIILHFFDPSGEEHERKLAEFDARVVQHEVDHLLGVLIVDYEKQ